MTLSINYSSTINCIVLQVYIISLQGDDQTMFNLIQIIQNKPTSESGDAFVSQCVLDKLYENHIESP